MEGRISRESLTGSTRQRPQSSYGTNGAYTERHESGQAGGYPARSPRSSYRSAYRSYRRRKPQPHGMIPEGRDLLIVQIFASGVLLLFVLFVSIVDSAGTRAVKDKLSDAFTESVSYEEVAEGASAVKNSVLNGEGSVLQIFGGEPEAESISTEGIVELADFPSQPQEPLTEEQDDADAGVVIDEETLKEIRENVNDDAKNR